VRSNLDFKVNIDRRSINYMRARKPGVAILPTVQNITQGKWDGPGLAKLLANPDRREKLANDIVTVLAANKLQGVTIDFENIPKAAHPDLESFLSRLSQLFAPHGWIIVQAAPFDDGDWPYKAYSQIVDYTMLMAYAAKYASAFYGPFRDAVGSAKALVGDAMAECDKLVRIARDLATQMIGDLLIEGRGSL